MNIRNLSLFILLIIRISISAQVSFVVETNARSINEASTFQVTFRLNNAQGSNFVPPDFNGFEVVNGPMRSMQSSFINGASSSSIGYVYTLLAKKSGNFNLGSARITVNGQTLKTNPISIKVIKQNSNLKNTEKEFFILASLDETHAYIGQQLTLTYKLYTRVNINNIEFASQPKLDKFKVNHYSLAREPVLTEVYQDVQYNTKVINKKAIYPLVAGTLIIEPSIFRMTIGDEDPFGSLFSNYGNQKIETIKTNELKIQVAELPEPKPHFFSGGVGQYKAGFSRVNRNYSLSDAIPISLNIDGNGNFNSIKPELIMSDSLFEISDAKDTEAKLITDDDKQVYNKLFTYLITPKKEGEHKLVLAFCYFDPKVSNYQYYKDSLIVNITKNIVSNGTELRSSDFKLMVANDGFFSSKPLMANKFTYILCLFPLLIFCFFKYENKWRQWRSSSMTSADASLQNIAIDQHALKKLKEAIQSQWPDHNLSACSDFELKQFLLQQDNNVTAVKFIKLFDHYNVLRYGQSSDSDWQNFMDRIS